ncbi:metallophosphoesterase [Candidatus Saccharibacteria bacterium]|nr:metallophosphoesterase [Candidatus Saccharibacteria bacterium]
MNFKEPVFCCVKRYKMPFFESFSDNSSDSFSCTSGDRAEKVKTKMPSEDKKHMSVALIGDLHINPASSEKQLGFLKKHLGEIRPDLVIIHGDLVDSAEYIDDKKCRKMLIRELKTCSEVAKTVGVLGNHDIVLASALKGRKKKKPEFFSEAEEKWKKIFNEAGAKLLVDEWFEMGKLRIFGFFQDEKCLVKGEKAQGNFLEIRKKIELLKKDRKLTTEAGKVNWFVSHIPIEELVSMKELKGFELFSFGHTHGGCVPVGVDRIVDKIGWNGGVISPRKKLFPKKQTRGVEILPNRARVIVNSGMTGIGTTAYLPFQYLNPLKAAEIGVVEF